MKILEIEFPTTGKIYEVEEKKADFKVNDQILVDSGQVVELADIKAIKSKRSVTEKEEFKGTILRKIIEKDKKKLNSLKKKAQEFLPLCEEKIKKYGLTSMKLLDADLSFDEKKLTFYFSTEGRIDFRELVSDLVRTFKKIIRLQQIGSRDKTKLFGGFGKCGRELCCFKFLPGVESITLDMAKEQGVTTSSSKISGACGKLMCCLTFELEEYKRLAKGMPEIGKVIKTKEGEGKVVAYNLLQQSFIIEKKDGQQIKVEK